MDRVTSEQNSVLSSYSISISFFLVVRMRANWVHPFVNAYMQTLARWERPHPLTEFLAAVGACDYGVRIGSYL
jgi:hypothetical protein